MGIVIAIGAAIALSSMGGPPMGMDNSAIPNNLEIPDPGNIDTVMGSGEMNPQVTALMMEGGFTADDARKLSDLTTEVLIQNATYLNYRQSLPSGESWDVVMKVFSDQTYPPTEQEILDAAASGMQVYNMSAVSYQVNDIPAMNIRYFVPFDAMSKELLAAIKPTESQPVSARSASLLPTAEAAGLSGAIFEFLFVGNMIELNSGHSIELEFEQLMQCAQNPTNPLTRRTFDENPEELQRTLDEIRSAQSEVSRLNTARVINVAAGLPGVLAHINPAIHVITEAAGHWSEHTLRHLTEERLEQARRAVVPCEEAPVSSSGTIQYSFSRTETGCGNYCWERKDERTGSGTFLLTTTIGSVGGNGSGTFGQTITEVTTEPPDDPQADYPIGSRAVSSGEVDIKVSGVAVPSGPSRLEFYANGDSLTYDLTGTWMEGVTDTVYPVDPVHRNDYGGGFSCVFDDVDLVNGGTYEVETEGGDGTCKLELAAG